MACCAFGTCDDPACYLCRVVAKLPQPSLRQHDAMKAESNPMRDGVAVKQNRDPVFTPRKRKALR